MKSLVLKDLYNIGHNSKTMIFMLLLFACIFIPSSGTETYIIMSGILCSMMIITTFSFDETSNWTKYAMIMPVSRKDVVAGKFIVLFIFSAIGVINGLVIGFIGGILTHRVDYSSLTDIVTLFAVMLAGLIVAVILGSISIPLMFWFGAEKARMLTLVSFFLPALLFFGIYKLLVFLGITITQEFLFILLCCSPLIALAWNYLMYKISCSIFSGKELL